MEPMNPFFDAEFMVVCMDPAEPDPHVETFMTLREAREYVLDTADDGDCEFEHIILDLAEIE